MPVSLDSLPIALVRFAGFAIDWLVTYAIHSTVIIGAVWWLTSRRSSVRLGPTQASWLWMAALVGGVLTATLQVSGLVPALGGTVRLGERLMTRAIVRVEVVARNDGPLPGMRGDGPTWLTARRTTILPRWSLAIIGFWAAGAVVGLGGLALARRRFFRSIAGRRSAGCTTAGHALQWVRARARIRHPIHLTVTDRLTSPVAIGRNEICLPARVLAEMDHVQQESMLAHEVAHLERRDGWRLMTARVIEATLFFQPLNRLARRRMQDTAELASDAWAVRVVQRPLVLARCLARVAEWTVAAPRAMVPAMVERSGSMLVRRVARLTRPDADVAPRSAWPAVAAGVLLLAGVMVVPRPVIGAGPVAPRVVQHRANREVRLLVRDPAFPLVGDSVAAHGPTMRRVVFVDDRALR